MSAAARARSLALEALRAGTIAGLAMMPFGAVFRAAGLRINEYGPKTLALLLGELEPPLSALAAFLQHLTISWLAAPPLLIVAARLSTRGSRVLAGGVYGAGFYVAVNSLALPILFGDPTPWQLGLRTIYPSLIVHVVYGSVVGALARGAVRGGSAR